jgi:protein-L-isoaspartate O-methyltransferase
MNGASPVSKAAFEAKYRRSNDPWDFAVSVYERARYDTTLQSLTRARYRRAFEPACSVGVLTAALAELCDSVYATDIAPSAVRLARRRCADLPNVSIDCADLAEHDPEGLFDLIVFSEVGYYFAIPQLARIARSLAARLEAGGELIGVHWLGDSADHLLRGDDVHACLGRELADSCTWLRGAWYPGFRLDVWRRR